jgi:hypothetical protein
MIWIPARDRLGRPRRLASRTPSVECLETRALRADGISVAPAAAITAILGVPITGAVFATYSVTDPTGAPGTQWLAKVEFGDGQFLRHVVPVQVGDQFEIEASHIYQAPGDYTVSVQVATPGSHRPNDNVATTQVIVSAPPSAIGSLAGSGVSFRAVARRTFRGMVARFSFSGPRTGAGQLGAMIFWGDESTPAVGRIRPRGRGQFQVVGAHSYAVPGRFDAFVTIQDAQGDVIAAESSAKVGGHR